MELPLDSSSSSGAAAVSDSAATLREGAKKLRDSLGIGRVHSDDDSVNNNHTTAANNGYASDSSIGAASGLSSHKGSVTPNRPNSDSPVSPGLGEFETFFRA